jgi:hypothetical protein
MAEGTNQKTANGFPLDFEARLRAAADKMRGHMDAAENKTLQSANTNCQQLIARVGQLLSLLT